MAIKCNMCGTDNPDGQSHCKDCGSALGAAANAKSAGGGSPRAKTMLFGTAPVIPDAAKPAPAKAPAPASNNGAAPMIKLGDASKPATTAKPQSNVVSNKTMLGVPAVQLPATQAAPTPMVKVQAKSAPTTRDSVEKQKTMIGMPALDQSDVQEAVAKAKAAAPEQPAERPAATAPEPSTTPQATNPNKVQTAPPVNYTPTPTYPIDAIDPNSLPQKNGLSTSVIVLFVVIGVVAIGVLAFAIARLTKTSGDDLDPQLLPGKDPSHLAILLNFPDAPPGATVQVQGQHIPIVGKKVQFQLPRKQLALGVNLVKLTYLAPQEKPEELSFPITLRHLITVNTDKLASTPPVVTVDIALLEGYGVTIDGNPCKLDGSVCHHQIPLSKIINNGQKTAAGAVYTLSFNLETPDGPEASQYPVVIPITDLTINRPAREALVETEEITCEGTVPADATVTVNGKPVTVTQAGFSTTVPLAKLGAQKITVTARAKGKAPITKTINVTRVAALAPYIDTFAKDIDPKFNYPKLSRNPAVHAGKKIKLSGRIVNINTQKGVTAFLLYVDDGCPTGGQCGVYVAFRGETEAGLQSMVNLYGTVRGTKDVDFAGGKKKTLPAIDATFVVPQPIPDAKKRR